MKNIVAELDSIAGQLERMEEPWAFHLASRLDYITEYLQVRDSSKDKSLNEVTQSVLNQYTEKMSYLSEKEPKLKKLIKNHENKNASEIHKTLKNHFGKLSRAESIEFIKKVLKNTDK